MIVCLDVQYLDDAAQAAAIVFDDWQSDTSVSQHTALVSQPAEYESGKFYLRELQPLLTVLEEIKSPLDAYVVDGYCYLSADRSPGLGAYLAEALDGETTVIGVAKNRYRDTRHAVELLRGGSSRPLFVTSIGIQYAAAAQHIKEMAGDHRLPTLLKAVDRLARTTPES